MAALIKRFSEAVKYNKKEVVCWGSGLPMREFLHAMILHCSNFST